MLEKLDERRLYALCSVIPVNGTLSPMLVCLD